MVASLALRAALAAACIAVAGCAAHPSPAATRPPSQPPDAGLTLLWTSSRATLGDERLEATFGDAVAFGAWWREATGGVEPLPAVDFATHVVVAASPGLAPNACHGVALRRARREADAVVVEVERLLPAPGATCAQVMVHPVVVAAIERPAAALRFEWRDRAGTP